MSQALLYVTPQILCHAQAVIVGVGGEILVANHGLSMEGSMGCSGFTGMHEFRNQKLKESREYRNA